MLIAVDLSRLYFAVRGLRIRLDYEKLFQLLKDQAPEGEHVEILAFTVANPENKKQAKFIERLANLGADVYTHDLSVRPSFSEELSACAAAYLGSTVDEKVVLVSNDKALMRVWDFLKGERMTLCFFSEKLENGWAQKILRDGTNFIDLSSADTLDKIKLQQERRDNVR